MAKYQKVLKLEGCFIQISGCVLAIAKHINRFVRYLAKVEKYVTGIICGVYRFKTVKLIILS